MDALGVPRTRGDGPQQLAGDQAVPGVFPAHAGMDRRSIARSCPLLHVFPAHAGMDRTVWPA